VEVAQVARAALVARRVLKTPAAAEVALAQIVHPVVLAVAELLLFVMLLTMIV
jgi:hypothetical protein